MISSTIVVSTEEFLMTDLSITAASVLWVSGVRPIAGKAGETITPGQTVYLDTTTNTWKLTDGDLDAASLCGGVCLDGGVSSRDIWIAPPGAFIQIGATPTAGTIYVCSLTAGGICPWADLASGDYVMVLFVGVASGVVELICKRGSTVHA
jgi:hypothetical protein